jgi:uncharacterized protein (TIGR00369 family)
MAATMQAVEDFERRVRENFSRQRIMRLLGARLLLVEPGRVEIELPFHEDLVQQDGYFHAGVLSTIADSAGGYAAYTRMPAGSSVLTAEYKLNFLRPAHGQRAIAAGRLVRPGRLLSTSELRVEVERDGERVECAVGLQTLVCVQGRPSGDIR